MVLLLGFGTSSSKASLLSWSVDEAPVPITLALKFVEFQKQDGQPILSESSVKDLVARINPYFENCKIRFQMEDYQSFDPKPIGLTFSIGSPKDMRTFRKPFDDSRYLVVINTHEWDHGKMGAPNAWTALPGEVPSGVVMEAPVAAYPGLVAHELGHYLSLKHVSNSHNLMSSVIYRDSRNFTSEQCNQMRQTAQGVRSLALRERGPQKPVREGT
jgi:hypothetical protein